MTQHRILLFHSQPKTALKMQTFLAEQGFLVHSCTSWEEILRTYEDVQKGLFLYILVDMTFCTDSHWNEFVSHIRQYAKESILISFYRDSSTCVYDLLGHSSPNGPERPQAARKMGAPGQQELGGIGKSPEFRKIQTLAARYAQFDITVLITGETGAGKEVMAHDIHANSPRRDGPYVACNVAAIPETLVESELFGHVKGAFTGASQDKKGLIGAAEGGTLFLDEIGDLPPSIQLKLLRLLENREYFQVGDSSVKTANVRIVAATNKDLAEEIANRRFREDLYYRLNRACVALPPLRERKEDIVPLAKLFCKRVCQQIDQAEKKLSQAAQVFLEEYHWPGNIRELRNAIESAILVTDGEQIAVNDLPLELQNFAANHGPEISQKLVRRMAVTELETITAALHEVGEDRTQAAALLGISVRTLYRKLGKLAGAKRDPASYVQGAPAVNGEGPES